MLIIYRLNCIELQNEINNLMFAFLQVIVQTNMLQKVEKQPQKISTAPAQ